MTEREKILARVREALTLAAPIPGHGYGAPGRPASATPVTQASSPAQSPREWLPLVGEGFADRLTLFQKNVADLKAEFHLLNNREDLAKSLLELRETGAWKKVGSHRGELTDDACRILALPVCRTDQKYDVNDLESCDAGITECDALIAQTGSVLVTSRSAGGRALSVLPPHHVVIAWREQLIPDLPEAFDLLK